MNPIGNLGSVYYFVKSFNDACDNWDGQGYDTWDLSDGNSFVNIPGVEPFATPSCLVKDPAGGDHLSPCDIDNCGRPILAD